MRDRRLRHADPRNLKLQAWSPRLNSNHGRITAGCGKPRNLEIWSPNHPKHSTDTSWANSQPQTTIDCAQEEVKICRDKIGHLEWERAKLEAEHALKVREMQQVMDDEREKFAMELIRLQVTKISRATHGREQIESLDLSRGNCRSRTTVF